MEEATAPTKTHSFRRRSFQLHFPPPLVPLLPPDGLFLVPYFDHTLFYCSTLAHGVSLARNVLLLFPFWDSYSCFKIHSEFLPLGCLLQFTKAESFSTRFHKHLLPSCTVALGTLTHSPAASPARLPDLASMTTTTPHPGTQ